MRNSGRKKACHSCSDGSNNHEVTGRQRGFSYRLVAPHSMKTASPFGQGGTSGGLWKGDPTHPGAARPLSLRATLPTGSSRKLEGIHRLLGIDLSSGQIATFCPVFVSLLNLKPLQPIFVHFKLGLKTLAGSISQQMVEDGNRLRISFVEIVSNAQRADQ